MRLNPRCGEGLPVTGNSATALHGDVVFILQAILHLPLLPNPSLSPESVLKQRLAVMPMAL